MRCPQLSSGTPEPSAAHGVACSDPLGLPEALGLSSVMLYSQQFRM